MGSFWTPLPTLKSVITYNGACIVRNVLDKNWITTAMVKKYISPNILGICLVALGMELHVIWNNKTGSFQLFRIKKDSHNQILVGRAKSYIKVALFLIWLLRHFKPWVHQFFHLLMWPVGFDIFIFIVTLNFETLVICTIVSHT